MKPYKVMRFTKLMYLFIPGESGCLRRKFACFSCVSCKEGGWRTATDDYRGKVKSESQQNISHKVVPRPIAERGTNLISKRVSNSERGTYGTFYDRKVFWDRKKN